MLNKLFISVLLVLAGLSCRGAAPGPQSQAQPASPRTEPLPVQQAKAYPETVTGRFVSLADFEDSPQGPRGRDQLSYFSVEPPDKPSGDRSSLAVVYNITRTGAGALAAALPARRELVFRVPHIHDFRNYTLLSFALHSPALRDDLRATVVTARGSWTSNRTLVLPGWNNVLIDIRHLSSAPDVDITAVDSLKIAFADSVSPVTFGVDDIMLIQNERAITPAPDGLKLVKTGLDYRLTLGAADPLALAQGSDGLWRLNRMQPVVQLSPPGQLPQTRDEDLALMGLRKVGQVELLENNSIRVRICSTWYFPTRSGEWASLAVRRLRWEYTFYGDGRWVTHLEVNNSGGRQIELVRVLTDVPVAMAGRTVSRELAAYGLGSDVGRWSFMSARDGEDKVSQERAYLNPGRIVPMLAAQDVYAAGDADRDRFDESEGCYVLGARSGHCRFTIHPPADGLPSAVFRILASGSAPGKAGRWEGTPSINMEGQVLRDVAVQGQNLLFSIPGRVDRPTVVEVLGRQVDDESAAPASR